MSKLAPNKRHHDIIQYPALKFPHHKLSIPAIHNSNLITVVYAICYSPCYDESNIIYNTYMNFCSFGSKL